MASKQDPTVVVLREIQKEIRGTNARLDQTNAHLDQTNTRLDQTNAHFETLDKRVETLDNRVETLDNRVRTLDNRVYFLGRRQTESEMRLDTEVAGVARTLGQVKDLLLDRLDDHGRVEDHERWITVLEAKGA